ncbi:unnamed protein product [Lampetra fluviatilis]
MMICAEVSQPERAQHRNESPRPHPQPASSQGADEYKAADHVLTPPDVPLAAREATAPQTRRRLPLVTRRGGGDGKSLRREGALGMRHPEFTLRCNGAELLMRSDGVGRPQLSGELWLVMKQTDCDVISECSSAGAGRLWPYVRELVGPAALRALPGEAMGSAGRCGDRYLGCRSHGGQGLQDSRERVDKSQVNLGGRFSSKLRSVWRGQSPFVPEGEGGSKEFQGQPGQQQHRRRRLGDGRGAGWIGGGGVAEREARGEEEGSGTVREAERGRAKAKEVEGYNLTGGGREAEGGGGGEGNVCLDSGSVVGRVSRSGGCGRGAAARRVPREPTGTTTTPPPPPEATTFRVTALADASMWTFSILT